MSGNKSIATTSAVNERPIIFPNTSATQSHPCRKGPCPDMHCRWHRLIEERQFVILDVYNLKLRVFTAFQDVVDPLCNGCGFPSWSRTTDDDSNFQHFRLSPFWCGFQVPIMRNRETPCLSRESD